MLQKVILITTMSHNKQNKDLLCRSQTVEKVG